TRALAAALDRPRSRRATAPAERRLDPPQLLAALRAELSPSAAADDASLRQEQLEEHALTLGRERWRERVDSVEAVRLALRQPGDPPQPVVRLEQLRVVPDVVPIAVEAVAVDRLAP